MVTLNIGMSQITGYEETRFDFADLATCDFLIRLSFSNGNSVPFLNPLTLKHGLPLILRIVVKESIRGWL
jgi:hypothetical protein